MNFYLYTLYNNLLHIYDNSWKRTKDVNCLDVSFDIIWQVLSCEFFDTLKTIIEKGNVSNVSTFLFFRKRKSYINKEI